MDRARDRLAPLGSPLVFFEITGSTNDTARSLVASGDCEGAVVIAGEQTAGRGRRGHTWHSPAGSGLYVSVVLTPAKAKVNPTRATSILTVAAGVALAEGIEAGSGLSVDLKWPNDLYVARRKVGGILSEGCEDPGSAMHVVVGYGINVSASSYPPELRDRATSLELELGRPFDADARYALIVETLAGLRRRYDDLLGGRFDAILDAWRSRAPASVGASVTWSGPSGSLAGVTAGIDDEGALLVRIEGRVEHIVSGEVIWL
jgi:BirA family transcriptional regulator, biotin operon repressor / biotin---[acetyl-CoA-carboxylase] ligase